MAQHVATFMRLIRHARNAAHILSVTPARLFAHACRRNDGQRGTPSARRRRRRRCPLNALCRRGEIDVTLRRRPLPRHAAVNMRPRFQAAIFRLLFSFWLLA